MKITNNQIRFEYAIIPKCVVPIVWRLRVNIQIGIIFVIFLS